MFVCFVCYCSECNSNRDSVLSYTSVRSNSSYLGSDEMGSGKQWTDGMKGNSLFSGHLWSSWLTVISAVLEYLASYTFSVAFGSLHSIPTETMISSEPMHEKKLIQDKQHKLGWGRYMIPLCQTKTINNACLHRSRLVVSNLLLLFTVWWWSYIMAMLLISQTPQSHSSLCVYHHIVLINSL